MVVKSVRFLKIALVAVILAAVAPFEINAEDFKNLPEKLVGHGGPIKAITISANGKRALTSSFDYSIILWDISGAKAAVIHRLIGHESAVNDALFLPDNNRAISVSDDGSLGIWNLTNGKLLSRLKPSEHKVLDVSLSPDGKFAAVSRWDGTARVYDLEAMQEISTLSGHRGNVNSSAFSLDGSKLYTVAYDGVVIEWDVKSGDQLRPIYRHGWGINSIDRIDGDRLVFGSLDGTVGVLSIKEAAKIGELAKSERPIQSVKVSRDASLVAYGDGAGTIGVFQADGGGMVEIAPVTFGPVWDFDFVADTNQIYHVGLDDFAARWQIAPRKQGQIVAKFPRRFQVRDSKDPGALEFQRKCSVCHTLTPDGANRAGPTLHKVFGREAGTLPGYPYSEALLSSKIIWNEETIGQLFDYGPDVVTPGTKMPIQRLKSVTRRDDLIRYLKEATASE